MNNINFIPGKLYKFNCNTSDIINKIFYVTCSLINKGKVLTQIIENTEIIFLYLGKNRINKGNGWHIQNDEEFTHLHRFLYKDKVIWISKQMENELVEVQ